MKKVILALSVLFLTACSTPSSSQLNIKPTASNHAYPVDENITFTLDSNDLRTYQYVAIVDNGRQQVKPIHAQQNLRVALEDVLANQLKKHGYTISVDTNNTLHLNIITALVNVKHSLMSNEIEAQVKLQITAETPKGKLAKTYNGVSKKVGSIGDDNQEIEQILNNLLNSMLDKIAVDQEFHDYLKENFK